MRNILKTIVISWLFLSCAESDFFTPTIEESCKSITINTNNDSLYFNCITDISLVPLEINEKSYYFTNPVMVNPNDSTIVLIDKRNGMVAGYVNYKNTFGRRFIGRGHGEFIEFGNAFTYNNLIGIYDCATAKCLFYDLNGIYVNQIVLEDRFCDEFYQINDKISVGFNINGGWGKGGHFYNIYNNENGKITQSDIYLSDIHSKLVTNNFPISYHNNAISFYVSYGYVIYGVNQETNNVYQQYYLDLDDKLNKTIIKNDLKDTYLLGKVIELGISGEITGFYETNRYYSFTTTYQRSIYKVLLDKNNEEGYAYNIYHGKDNDTSFLNQLFKVLIPIGSFDNDIYMYCDLNSFNKIKNNCKNSSDKKMNDIINQVNTYIHEYSLDEDTKLFFRILLNE